MVEVPVKVTLRVPCELTLNLEESRVIFGMGIGFLVAIVFWVFCGRIDGLLVHQTHSLTAAMQKASCCSIEERLYEEC